MHRFLFSGMLLAIVQSIFKVWVCVNVCHAVYFFCVSKISTARMKIHSVCRDFITAIFKFFRKLLNTPDIHSKALYYIFVPSGNSKKKLYLIPMALAIFCKSIVENIPRFIRWLNAPGVTPRRRASSASLMLWAARAIFIFCVMLIIKLYRSVDTASMFYRNKYRNTYI